MIRLHYYRVIENITHIISSLIENHSYNPTLIFSFSIVHDDMLEIRLLYYTLRISVENYWLLRKQKFWALLLESCTVWNISKPNPKFSFEVNRKQQVNFSRTTTRIDSHTQKKIGVSLTLHLDDDWVLEKSDHRYDVECRTLPLVKD